MTQAHTCASLLSYGAERSAVTRGELVSKKLTVLVDDGGNFGPMKFEYTGKDLEVVPSSDGLVAVVEDDLDPEDRTRAVFSVSRLIGVLYGEDVSL